MQRNRLLLPLALLASLFAPLFGNLPALAAPAKAADPATCNTFYQGNRPPAIVGPPARGGLIYCHSFYVVLYSTELRNPVWTSYRLTREMALGGDNTTRIKGIRFHLQRGLSGNDQGRHTDFVHPPYDRGHMVPANDAIDRPHQEDTFVVTNIVPQASNLNQHLWQYLEASVHSIARDHGVVFIVTGPIFSQHPELMHRPHQAGRIAVPDFTYKAIFVPALNIAIAYIARNQDPTTCSIVSIAALARQAGIDPFPALPAALKATRPEFTLPPGLDDRGNPMQLPDCRAAP